MTQGARNQTSTKRLEQRERARKALELRKNGVSYDDICTSLGFKSRAAAFKAVMSCLNRLEKEPAEEVRKLEVSRIERLWMTYYPKAVKGDIKAAELCIKLASRRADLEGLDQPKEIRGILAQPATFSDFLLMVEKEDERRRVPGRKGNSETA